MIRITENYTYLGSIATDTWSSRHLFKYSDYKIEVYGHQHKSYMAKVVESPER